MLPLADGSDYAGSLRNPAGWNNVFGFRTSIGLVPADGRDAFLLTMGVLGPMARNVSDLALLLSVQAGYDARVPLSIAGDGAAFRGSLGDSAGASRDRRLWRLHPLQPGARLQTALKTQSAGRTVRSPAIFSIEAPWRAFLPLRAWQTTGPLCRRP
jgi:amidase